MSARSAEKHFHQLQFGRASDRWVLKMVESGYSFKSAENIPQLLYIMDKESKIFPKMTLGRQKCGYYVTHALYPFYFEALIKRILEVPACLTYWLTVNLFSSGSTNLFQEAFILFQHIIPEVIVLFVELRPFSPHIYAPFCRILSRQAFTRFL